MCCRYFSVIDKPTPIAGGIANDTCNTSFNLHQVVIDERLTRCYCHLPAMLYYFFLYVFPDRTTKNTEWNKEKIRDIEREGHANRMVGAADIGTQCK